ATATHAIVALLRRAVVVIESGQVVSVDCSFFFYGALHHRALHSFPTRRSSDLAGTLLRAGLGEDELGAALELEPKCRGLRSLLRSEEHTSELQSPYEIVCRLLLEKKNTARSWDA